jgi:hypothetical protein
MKLKFNKYFNCFPIEEIGQTTELSSKVKCLVSGPYTQGGTLKLVMRMVSDFE